MKTLYLSDLDGTLLNSCERVSGHTCRIINALVAKGTLFSYATARSLVTARKAADGLEMRIPLIVYNGAMIVDHATGERLQTNFFDENVLALLDRMFAEKIFPIVYAFVEGEEKFSFVPALNTPGMTAFLKTREGDVRTRAVDQPEELKKGHIFYLNCIDDPEKLEPLYEAYKKLYHCVYQNDIYTGDHWLEIMPYAASKANAAIQLKDMLGCDRIVAFGDAKNDIDLFEAADEGYAVFNAHEDLKKVATGIIPSNDEDGVAKWLEAHI